MKFKLHHISIYSNNIIKIKNFYYNLFKFKNVHTFKDKKGKIYGYFLYINKSNFIEILNAQKKIKKKNINFHFCLILQKNFYVFYEKCKKRGILLEDELPRRGRTDKVLHFKIIDPDGNICEIHLNEKLNKLYRYN